MRYLVAVLRTLQTHRHMTLFRPILIGMLSTAAALYELVQHVSQSGGADRRTVTESETVSARSKAGRGTSKQVTIVESTAMCRAWLSDA